MNELLNKTVKIVFNQAVGHYGLIGTTATVDKIDSGFVIVTDCENNTSYYSLQSIKSITVLDDCQKSTFVG